MKLVKTGVSMGESEPRSQSVCWMDELFKGGIYLPDENDKPLTMLITGPPGGGKTTLALEFCYRMASLITYDSSNGAGNAGGQKAGAKGLLELVTEEKDSLYPRPGLHYTEVSDRFFKGTPVNAGTMYEIHNRAQAAATRGLAG